MSNKKIVHRNAQFWAKLGLINISVQPAQLHAGYYKIAEVVIHPFYDHVSDDVALFRLKTAVEFSAFIRPICLNTDASMTFETATVTGWSLHEEGEFSFATVSYNAMRCLRKSCCIMIGSKCTKQDNLQKTM